VHRVGDEASIVKGDLDSLSTSWVGELDGERGTIGLESLGGQGHARWSSGVTLKVRRSIDLVAPFGGIGMLGVGSVEGHFDGVGARNEESAVEEEKSNTVVEAGDGGLGSSGPALALGLCGVVDQDLECGLGGKIETLSTLLSTVDPDDGTVSEQSTFDHTTALWHGVQFPSSSTKRLDATAGRISRGSDVLVRATTANDDIRVPLVSAGEGKEDRTTSVGVGAVITWQIWESLDDGVGTDVEALGRLGSEDKEVAILHEMDEWIHVVWLVLGQDGHGNALSLGTGACPEDLVCGIVVFGLGGVETVERSRCNEDSAIGQDLERSVPTRSAKLAAGFEPGLSVERGIASGALEQAKTLETVSDSGVEPVQIGIATGRQETAISQEDTARAESIGLVGERGELLCVGIILGGIGILSIGKLELSVVLDLVQEDDLAVGHESSVHSGDTRATLDGDGSRLGGGRSRAGSRRRRGRWASARSGLAARTAMGGCASAVTVHGAARALDPSTTDGVAESGTASTVGSLLSSGSRWGSCD
jgi:hypothetical protein